MELSYAQAMEDMHLARLFAGEPPGLYVDVGGNHPVADNVSLKAYLAGWRGLVVEPQAALAARHRAIRPRDTVAEVLVGRTDGTATFHEVEGLHGLSTMVERAASDAGRETGRAVHRRERPLRRLAGLLAEHGITRIDWLKIDVEGAEAEVIAGHDWRGLRPRVVVVEAMHPVRFTPSHDSFEPLLLAADYALVLFDGLNRWYVAREAAALADRLPAAPLPWDSARHLWDLGDAAVNPAHPDHGLARALAPFPAAELPLLEPGRLAAALVPEAAAPACGEALAALRATIEGGEPCATALPPDFAEGLTLRAAAEALLASDPGRVALGRIAARHDGGFAD